MGLLDYTIKLLGLSETLHRWHGLIRELDAGRREKVARYAERIAETLSRAAAALAALEKEPGSARAGSPRQDRSPDGTCCAPSRTAMASASRWVPPGGGSW